MEPVKPDIIGQVTLAVSDWIEEHRGWIDCVSFSHPTEGDKMWDSLMAVIDKQLDPHINEDWGN